MKQGEILYVEAGSRLWSPGSRRTRKRRHSSSKDGLVVVYVGEGPSSHQRNWSKRQPLIRVREYEGRGREWIVSKKNTRILGPVEHLALTARHMSEP